MSLVSTTTTATTDIRLRAWSFGRNVGTLAQAYLALELGNDDAVAVFAALSRNEWGVKAAFADGLKGVNIELRDPTTGITKVLTGRPVVLPARRRPVAANGGTI